MAMHEAYFKQLVANNHLVHAYAFSGLDTAQKEETTKYITTLLACKNKITSGEPCGTCDVCRRVKEGNFPDVLYVEPDGRSIRVSQIRELKQWVSTTPVEASFKIAVITQAELMNTAASNALLTVLEEPVSHVYIILWAKNAANLLPTIQSRVQKLSFDSADYKEMQANYIAQGYSAAHAFVLAHLPSENIQLLMDNYEGQEFDQWLKDFHYFYQLLIQGEMQSFVVIQTHLNKHLKPVPMALLGIDYLLFVNYHLLLKISDETNAQTPALYDAFFKNLLEKAQPNLTQLLNINQQLLQAKQYIQANVSSQLALEQLIISLIGGKK